MYDNINNTESKIMAKSIAKGYEDDNGIIRKPKSVKEIINDMQLIDDLLNIMKSKSLLNRKNNLKKAINARLTLDVHPDDILIGGSNDNIPN
jgi:hypothetical protein